LVALEYLRYEKNNDFFYSGHVGIPLICGLEFKRNGYLWVLILCIFVSIFEGFVMVSNRAHYGIDVIIGIICAHYFFKITESYINIIDNSWMNISETYIDTNIKRKICEEFHNEKCNNFGL
jgi:hypothetical protein